MGSDFLELTSTITFVERQIAHAWAGSIALSTLLFALEALLDLPVLSIISRAGSCRRDSVSGESWCTHGIVLHSDIGFVCDIACDGLNHSQCRCNPRYRYFSLRDCFCRLFFYSGLEILSATATHSKKHRFSPAVKFAYYSIDHESPI